MLFTLRHVILPTIVTSLAVTQSSPAAACGATPCAQVNDVQPSDGSVGVPLNAQLRVLYFGSPELYTESLGCEIDTRRLRLVSDGSTLDLTGTSTGQRDSVETWIVARPGEPLLADTTYEIQIEMAGGVEVCACDDRQWVTVSTFTTGAAEDLEQPSFAGVSAFEYGEYSDVTSSCGRSKLVPAAAQLGAVDDASPGVRYNVYFDGVLTRRYEQGPLGPDMLQFYVDCAETGSFSEGRVAVGARVEARAIDIAGNESAPNTGLDIADVCGAVDGTGDTDDTDPTDNEDSEHGDATGQVVNAGSATSAEALDVQPEQKVRDLGCSVAVAGGASVHPAWWALLPVLAWWRARRRSLEVSAR